MNIDVFKVDRRTISTDPNSTGGTVNITVSEPRVALDDPLVSSVALLVRRSGEADVRPSPPLRVSSSNTATFALAPSTFGVNSDDGYNDVGEYKLVLLVTYSDGSKDSYAVGTCFEIIDGLEIENG